MRPVVEVATEEYRKKRPLRVVFDVLREGPEGGNSRRCSRHGIDLCQVCVWSIGFVKRIITLITAGKIEAVVLPVEMCRGDDDLLAR